ncbi:mCG148357 [Mus musculus]|nr:mCG148357 [Mus musculus]
MVHNFMLGLDTDIKTERLCWYSLPLTRYIFSPGRWKERLAEPCDPAEAWFCASSYLFSLSNLVP